MTEPRLRGGDQPARNLCAVIARELADGVVDVGIPWQRDRTGRQIVLAGQVEKRGQQWPLAKLTGGDELRHRKGLQTQVADARPILKVDESEGTVGGAQIDSDEVTHESSECPILMPNADASSKYIIRMTDNTIGLDIGGANLKAATPGGRALTRPFELWKHPDRVANALAQLALAIPTNGPVAVTTTGELCDCFETKRDGVRHILAAVEAVFGAERVRVWSTDGRFMRLEDARNSPLLVAAANWHALATFVGRWVAAGPALLIDIGSTTTDIIPIIDGRPAAQGRTDMERMATRELVYTGVQRTPVCALLGSNVAAELFATTLDVYLMLGMTAEDPTDRGTADGRPATIRHAHARLARMLGGDGESVAESVTQSLAERAFQAQKELITGALDEVCAKLSTVPSQFVIAGSGEFLVRQVVDRAFAESSPTVISLNERLGPQVSVAACAHAIAVLASEIRE